MAVFEAPLKDSFLTILYSVGSTLWETSTVASGAECHSVLRSIVTSAMPCLEVKVKNLISTLMPRLGIPVSEPEMDVHVSTIKIAFTTVRYKIPSH